MNNKHYNIQKEMDLISGICAIIDRTNIPTHYLLTPEDLQNLLQKIFKEGYEEALKDFTELS